MNTLVIDASVAVKWVVEEQGTPEALALRQRAKLIALELLVAECANILWKKVQRVELLKEEALLAARLLQGAEIELLPTRSALEAATRLAIDLDHPPYDCLYLALALTHHCPFVTAAERFLRKRGQVRQRALRGKAISLAPAARQ
jgi:predicted nucleic acid-binding protein